MLKPLLDRVVLEKIEQEKKTASGIILTDVSKEAPSMAKVIAVGPGKVEDGVLVSPDVNIGDIVIYKPYAVTTVKVDGKEVLICDAKDLLAIVA